jgi:hypothetical protein
MQRLGSNFPPQYNPQRPNLGRQSPKATIQNVNGMPRNIYFEKVLGVLVGDMQNHARKALRLMRDFL